MKALTARQADILQYIINFIEDNLYSPTYREIGAHFGIRSTNGVSDHLRALTRKGYIRFREGQRTIVVLCNPQNEKLVYKLVRVPVEEDTTSSEPGGLK